MLVERGRLALTVDVAEWLQLAEGVPGVRLPRFPHPDPADRLIVATALGAGGTLVTADRRLRGYAPLKTMWN